MQVSLSEPSLGTLELGCYPYVVTSLQISAPEVRAVMRNRALADGAIDDTKYTGSRAVTVVCTLHNGAVKQICDEQGQPALGMQDLYDRVMPYMNPRIRPRLAWQLPRSDSIRSVSVRGANWPLTVERALYPSLALQWVAPDGEIVADDGHGGGDICTEIQPSVDIEDGRNYDLTFDRSYPESLMAGERLLVNQGTAPANWTLTIWGHVSNPTWSVNGVEMRFDQNGGIDLLGGTSIVVDTRTHTALLNGEVGSSVYDRLNYREWNWDSLKLMPGDNLVRFGGDPLGLTGICMLCYRPTYL